MLAQCIARPKMHNQTPRHSSTKHIKKQGTINALSQALGLHNMGAHQDPKERKERTTNTFYFCEKNSKVLKILKFRGNTVIWDSKKRREERPVEQNFIRKF